MYLVATAAARSGAQRKAAKVWRWGSDRGAMAARQFLHAACLRSQPLAFVQLEIEDPLRPGYNSSGVIWRKTAHPFLASLQPWLVLPSVPTFLKIVLVIVLSQQLSGAAMGQRYGVKCAVLVAVVVARSGAQDLVRRESSGRN